MLEFLLNMVLLRAGTTHYLKYDTNLVQGTQIGLHLFQKHDNQKRIPLQVISFLLRAPSTYFSDYRRPVVLRPQVTFLYLNVSILKRQSQVSDTNSFQFLV